MDPLIVRGSMFARSALLPIIATNSTHAGLAQT